MHLLSEKDDYLINIFIYTNPHKHELLSVDHSVYLDLFQEKNENSNHYPIRVLHVNPEIKVYYTIIEDNSLEGFITTRENIYFILGDVYFDEVEEMMDSLEIVFNNLEDKNFYKKILREQQTSVNIIFLI